MSLVGTDQVPEKTLDEGRSWMTNASPLGRFGLGLLRSPAGREIKCQASTEHVQMFHYLFLGWLAEQYKSANHRLACKHHFLSPSISLSKYIWSCVTDNCTDVLCIKVRTLSNSNQPKLGSCPMGWTSTMHNDEGNGRGILGS